MDQQKRVLKLSLTYFTILGLNPLKKMRIFQVFCTILSFLILLVLVFLRLIFEEVDFKVVSDTFESTFSIVHVLSKLIPLSLKNDIFKELLENADKFQYTKNSNCEQILKVLRAAMTTYFIFVSTTAVLFIFRPIFGDNLALNCYIPPKIPLGIFTIFNNVVFFGAAFSVGSYDMFVCIMLVLVYVQFKILNQEIVQLNLNEIESVNDEKNCLDKMKVYVQYHIFLYGMLEKFTSVVSVTFLIHFILAPISLCFELFFILKSSKLVEIIKSCFYVTGISVELIFFYCLPATLLHVESEKMVNVLYNCGWHSCKSLSLQKNIIIMMQRTQKPATISAGKMFPVNLESCTQVFKMALSFFTCLRIFEDNSG